MFCSLRVFNLNMALLFSVAYFAILITVFCKTGKQLFFNCNIARARYRQFPLVAVAEYKLQRWHWLKFVIQLHCGK